MKFTVFSVVRFRLFLERHHCPCCLGDSFSPPSVSGVSGSLGPDDAESSVASFGLLCSPNDSSLTISTSSFSATTAGVPSLAYKIQSYVLYAQQNPYHASCHVIHILSHYKTCGWVVVFTGWSGFLHQLKLLIMT